MVTCRALAQHIKWYSVVFMVSMFRWIGGNRRNRHGGEQTPTHPGLPAHPGALTEKGIPVSGNRTVGRGGQENKHILLYLSITPLSVVFSTKASADRSSHFGQVPEPAGEDRMTPPTDPFEPGSSPLEGSGNAAFASVWMPLRPFPHTGISAPIRTPRINYEDQRRGVAALSEGGSTRDGVWRASVNVRGLY